MSPDESNSSWGATGNERGLPPGGWMDRWLPPTGFERKVFLWLAAIVLGLKVLAIYHFRADSDETQHAHVVWGWVTGQLQYRDIFDNHMPLFQMLFAPVMALIGERADVMVPLRWAMVPLYLLCLWVVYRLTDLLYSRRAAPWSALCVGAFPLFFYTSTEFRTDDLWALLWLLSLLVAVSGKSTIKRALGFGLILGLAFAVSLKTVVLLSALLLATVIALAFAWWRGERPRILGIVARVLAIVGMAVIPPAAMAYYFARQGAFWIMYYCVICHNVVPGLKRWGHFNLHEWYFPVSLVPLLVYAWLIFRQTKETPLAIRRAIILLTPWIFLFLLWSYWPDITREDDLPYTPLLALCSFPLLILAAPLVRYDTLRRKFWTYALPALVLCELIFTFRFQNLRENRLRVTTDAIAAVLKVTGPKDDAMDNKGEYVFRHRPYYWVLEPITRARVRMGLIKDNIPQRLIQTGTKVCYLRGTRNGTLASQFIVANYMPFAPEATAVGALGKEIGRGTLDGTFPFDVVIPQTYAVMTETGQLAGELDGKPYAGPAWLAAGRHQFHRTSGSGRVAILLKDVCDKGFSPLFDAAELVTREVGTPRPDREGKEPELQ